jgi:acetolactate synthase-1/2/3 large subunit
MSNLTDLIVDYLIKNKVTNMFGIPGGSVLDFLYSADKRKAKITSHVLFSEFSSVYAAIGSAQVNYELGVAFVSKGPGLTNSLTPIADAYYDSIPLLIITGHSSNYLRTNARIDYDQDIDVHQIFGSITKEILTINDIDDFESKISYAIDLTMLGRPGPVIIDLNNELIRTKELVENRTEINLIQIHPNNYFSDYSITPINQMIFELEKSTRPVILVGNGLRISHSIDILLDLSVKSRIPIISSRTSQDLFPNYEGYLGYIGSRGIRSANIIMDRSDLILIIGNRAMYPKKSNTYNKLLAEKKVYWIEFDQNELTRDVHENIVKVNADIKKILFEINTRMNKVHLDWYSKAIKLKDITKDTDTAFPVSLIAKVLSSENKESIIVSDVGNNELWVSLAYSKGSLKNRIIHSKSLSVMGTSLAKSIGISCDHKSHVMCCVGDQGINSNLSDLYYIANKKLPITIIIINNFSSGMIKDRQKSFGYREGLLVTNESGYINLSYEEISRSINVDYLKIEDLNIDSRHQFFSIKGPKVIELVIPQDTTLIPFLPSNNSISEQMPTLSEKIYSEITETMELD